jgi:O-antigen ligase
MVPMTLRLAEGDRAVTVLNVIIAAGAIGAVVGVVQGTMLGFDSLSNRPEGSLTHYMTYSGVIMLVLSATVARLLFVTGSVVWPAIALPALVVALTLTWTRNAWLGALAAAMVLVALRRPRLLVLFPVIVGVAVLVAPEGIRARMWSIADVNDASNRDRLQMLAMGAEMVRDHPLFGVGPDVIRTVYPEYRPPDAVNPTNPHLHNVPVNIAAERGLPALGAWLWFVVVAVLRLVRLIRHREPAGPLAAAGLAAIAAMVTAGMFEYNFGDSEFLMLFLGLITLPEAAMRGTSRNATASGAPAAATQ